MKKQVAKTRAPNGFHFEIYCYVNHYADGYQYGMKSGIFRLRSGQVPECFESVYVRLVRNGEDGKRNYIGHVELMKLDKKRLETHSNLEPSFHGKGFGVKIYARAIQWALENGFKVESSGSSSTEAQRVWRGKRLKQKFRIIVRHDGNRKSNYDPDYDQFYAYAR